MRKEDLRIVPLDAEQWRGEAGADEMRHDEQRNAQAEQELCHLDAGPAELAVRIQRPQSQPHVDEDRAIEHDQDRPALPEYRVIVERLVHHAERDVPSAWLAKWLVT